MHFVDFTQKIYTLIGNNSNNLNNYESLLNEIIKKIEISLGYVEDKYYNQAIQYNENELKKNFKKKYEANKVKYIEIPIEDIIICQRCNMKFYNFKFIKSFYLNEPLKSNLSEKIFFSNIEKRKYRGCNFCNGQETICVFEEKIIEYPD